MTFAAPPPLSRVFYGGKKHDLLVSLPTHPLRGIWVVSTR